MEKIAAAGWFAFPTPFQYGIEFVPGAIILMLFMAIVTTIETIGDISATTMGGANREATDKELSGGIMADGLGTAFGSIFNAMPNTSYSQNAGLVAFTGVISRHVGTVAGVILILLGLFPKLGGIIAAMPESVIGGAAIIMFGLITSAGIKLIARSEMNQRNLLILGLSLSFGIGMSLLPQFVSHIPDFGISFKITINNRINSCWNISIRIKRNTFKKININFFYFNNSFIFLSNSNSKPLSLPGLATQCPKGES